MDLYNLYIYAFIYIYRAKNNSACVAKKKYPYVDNWIKCKGADVFGLTKADWDINSCFWLEVRPDRSLPVFGPVNFNLGLFGA
jgi:hypothetical protein